MLGNREMYVWTRPDGRRIVVVHGDLTAERVDAVVNAANEHLVHGGGVAGAIVRKGGQEIQEASRRWVQEHGPVPTGGAAITPGGRLPARYVIHAVGPRWGMGDEKRLLYRAVQSALRLAHEHHLTSVALPAISTGIFGFPKPLGVKVILDAVVDFLDAHPETTLREVRLCNIDRYTCDLFVQALQERAGSGE